jgi:hypothetical protein
LIEIEEQPTPVIASHTNTPQKQENKRSRKDGSPSIIEVSTEDFQAYRKRAKTSHAPKFLKEGEIQSTIVVEGPHSLAYSNSQFTVSTSSSKKQTDTTLIAESSHEKT